VLLSSGGRVISHLKAAPMADILIRDVPDAVLAELDASAARAGMSRVEYLRRVLADEAERARRASRPPITHEDWAELAELTKDLGDPEVMRGAWS
jgi:hypothetical protein